MNSPMSKYLRPEVLAQMDREFERFIARRDQVDAPVSRNQILVISQGALAFGLGFQRAAQRFRALKLSLGSGAAGSIVVLRGGRRDSAKCHSEDYC